MLGLVARGEVVHPTVASLPDYYTHPGVTTVPLRDLPPVESALVWCRRRQSAAIRAFAELALAAGRCRWRASRAFQRSSS